MNRPTLRRTTVAVIQNEMSEDCNQNVEKAIDNLRQAVEMGAKVVCLPELFSSLYFANEKNRESANHYLERIDGKTTTTLCRFAKERKIVIVGGSIYEEFEGKKYNSSPIIDADGSVIEVHRKAHIPNDPGYNEKYYFTPGDKAVTVAETAYGKIGVGICYDQWFPQVSSNASLMGAEILFYPTAIGFTNEEIINPIVGDDKWNLKLRNALRGQAAMGNMYIAMANRIGKEGPTEFFGESCIIDFNGEVVSIAEEARSQVVTAVCNLGIIKNLNLEWAFHANRRPELYN